MHQFGNKGEAGRELVWIYSERGVGVNLSEGVISTSFPTIDKKVYLPLLRDLALHPFSLCIAY